jgi:hypothetical protein
MERGSRRRFRLYGSPSPGRRVVIPRRPWSWRPGAVAVLVGLLLAIWVLPGSALAAAPAGGPGSEGSQSPVSIKSIVPESCRTSYKVANSGQVAYVTACLERLPGGIRAHYYFSVDRGTANFKGTLNTCNELSCPRKSRDFWFRGVGPAGVAVATDWDSTCPRVSRWYGLVRLLDIRFMPSGELKAGAGPYYTNTHQTNAC